MTTDTDRINWLQERLFELDWALVEGCCCGCCMVFRIRCLDDGVIAQAETLREAIDHAQAIYSSREPKP